MALGKLIPNMRQQNHVRALTVANRPRAISPVATRADIHNLAQALDWEFVLVFFPSRALLRNTLPGSE